VSALASGIGPWSPNGVSTTSPSAAPHVKQRGDVAWLIARQARQVVVSSGGTSLVHPHHRMRRSALERRRRGRFGLASSGHHSTTGTEGAAVIHVGTSGWQYDDWRGRFYPASLPARAWLDHFATCFETVEVNNSFYRLPPRTTFERWNEQTPEGFVMAVKASR